MESHEPPAEDASAPQHDAAAFQDAVMSVLMAAEELRQTTRRPDLAVESQMVLDWKSALEELLSGLDMDMDMDAADDVQRDMRAHCRGRVADAAECAFDRAVTKSEGEDVGDLEAECQGAVARMAEINMALRTDAAEEIIDTYVGYQRQVLRQRAKPAISRLVAMRKHEAELAASGRSQHTGGNDDDDLGEDEDEDDQAQRSSHIHILTVILGQASALIHPLIAWRANLAKEQTHLRQLCTRSIDMLDDQAQALSKTVCAWFVEDRSVESWLGKSTNANIDNGEDEEEIIDLGELDSLVEEMAFACQVFARYVALVKEHTTPTGDGDDSKPVAKEIHPVWTWNYASLERYLGTQQWKSALRCANPVHIVIGTSVQVPSVVEDAQYLSTRALERAASTRSTQAIGIVAQSIANDVWSTDIDIGVHRALTNETGCWQEPDSGTKAGTDSGNGASGELVKKAPSSFAAAFLGALDQPTKSRSPSKPPSAPSSGAFLSFGGGGSDRLQQIRIETSLCALNGLHSASASCSSLVEFLDSLLPNEEIQQDGQSAPMIQLAREELFRFADEYKQMLQNQTRNIVNEWCGLSSDVVTSLKSSTPCLPAVRYFLDNESYELSDATALQAAEDDARLEQHLLRPLQTSKLLQHLNRCEAHVLSIVCDLLTDSLVTLVMDCLLESSKRVNDWGALLLSKQVRMLQNFVSQKLEAGLDGGTIPAFAHWERLSQAVTALQLETPSDWILYQSTSVLTPEELRKILLLRVDFSKEAVSTVITSIAGTNKG